MRQLTGTKLVILNAGSTYIRMFLCAGLTLFSSRWILAALGQVDFGLYAVIAGVMGFLSFLTGAMAGSAQRHFAFAIGKGDLAEVNKWFNASLALHFCLAVMLVIIGLPFGRYMIDHVLTIPPDRLDVCHKVFWCTLTTVFFRQAYSLILKASGAFIELS
jgi:Na+-driven multidrug efflux pump